MKPSDVISDESKWCRGSMARNADGDGTWPNSADACQWCAMGAIERAFLGDEEAQWDALDKLEDLVAGRLGGGFSLGHYNDHHTYEAVRDLLLEAGL